jgi:hypothetical protein
MNRVARVGLGVVVGLVGLPLLAVVSVAAASRFADGPLVDFLPGGVLVSGAWVEHAPSDWSFVAKEHIVEFESDGRSRRVWILAADGKAYIPASLGFPPFKTWHLRALEEPEAVVRIDGKRYARRLAKINDPALEVRLAEQVRRKYGGPPTAEAWFFRLDPPE